MFFSGRYYRIIHLLDIDNDDPQSTIAGLRERLMQLGARGAGFLAHCVSEQEEVETAYVLTPLYNSELKELIE